MSCDSLATDSFEGIKNVILTLDFTIAEDMLVLRPWICDDASHELANVPVVDERHWGGPITDDLGVRDLSLDLEPPRRQLWQR